VCDEELDMSAVATSISPQEAVQHCEAFLHSFVPEAKDILVEGFDMEKKGEWIITLGFNLPSPLDELRSPLGRPSLERDHHRRFKFNIAKSKVISMAPESR
jgi:hypothetical protein